MPLFPTFTVVARLFGNALSAGLPARAETTRVGLLAAMASPAGFFVAVTSAAAFPPTRGAATFAAAAREVLAAPRGLTMAAPSTGAVRPAVVPRPVDVAAAFRLAAGAATPAFELAASAVAPAFPPCLPMTGAGPCRPEACLTAVGFAGCSAAALVDVARFTAGCLTMGCLPTVALTAARLAPRSLAVRSIAGSVVFLAAALAFTVGAVGFRATAPAFAAEPVGFRAVTPTFVAGWGAVRPATIFTAVGDVVAELDRGAATTALPSGFFGAGTAVTADFFDAGEELATDFFEATTEPVGDFLEADTAPDADFFDPGAALTTDFFEATTEPVDGLLEADTAPDADFFDPGAALTTDFFEATTEPVDGLLEADTAPDADFFGAGAAAVARVLGTRPLPAGAADRGLDTAVTFGAAALERAVAFGAATPGRAVVFEAAAPERAVVFGVAAPVAADAGRGFGADVPEGVGAVARVPVPDGVVLGRGPVPEAAGLVEAFLAAGIEVFLLANGHVRAGRLAAPAQDGRSGGLRQLASPVQRASSASHSALRFSTVSSARVASSAVA